MTDPIQNLIDVAKTQLCRSDCLDPGVGCCKPNLVEAIRAASEHCTRRIPVITHYPVIPQTKELEYYDREKADE